jgi:holo-[acyl-carrier protein] synthase
MIVGIGVDLVSIERLAESLENEAFKRKVFLPDEITDCERFANSDERYAGKFVAKEALMKALGAGIRQAVGFQQIEIHTGESGAPSVYVRGKAKDILDALGAERIHVSISHTGGMAVAVVVLERE